MEFRTISLMELFSKLVNMDDNELKIAIKSLSKEQRIQLSEMMGLSPHTTTQSAMCKHIIETNKFIRAQSKQG
jgi:hypothetical protein